MEENRPLGKHNVTIFRHALRVAVLAFIINIGISCCSGARARERDDIEGDAQWEAFFAAEAL